MLFPLSFISNAMVPTTNMPDWLRTFSDGNPVSAVTAACRTMWGNPNPSSASLSWSMQHPIETAIAWSVAILAIAVPLSLALYRRRTTN